MNERIITYKNTDIPSYIRGIAAAGICPALCRGGFYTEDGALRFCFCASGMKSFKALLNYKSNLPFPELLVYLRSVLEAARLLPDYLIPEDMISLDLNDIYFDENSKALLVLKDGSANFFSSFVGLCRELSASYPACNADIAADRLEAENASQLLDCKSMLSLLSRWQYEYR